MILTLRNVSKSFGALRVSDDVSFDLGRGEALGIIGPNGAGKSTLFNLIAGNLRVDSGHIALNGEDVTTQSAMNRCISGIGRSFQIPQPFSQMSVYENLLVAAQYGGGKRASDAAGFCADILARLGMTALANTQSRALTLLQRKRLELARALATDPKVILLDEIAGGLTQGECEELVGTIRGIHAAGTSIIWIEHVLHALNAVVERLMVLNFGKIIGIGKPADVMSSREVREIYLGIDV
jgi:branched-chain amino acid transport system ATP-binding protein